MRRRRLIAITAISVFALLLALGVAANQLDARAAVQVPPFPPQAHCPEEIPNIASESKMRQVAINVTTMLQLVTDNSTDRWIGQVPANTRREDIFAYYDEQMPSPLRADNRFPDLGVEYDLRVWSYDGWFADRAIAVALLWEVKNGTKADGFQWLLVIDSNEAVRSGTEHQSRRPRCAARPA